MPQLTYQQAKALKSKIVEKLKDDATKNVKKRQRDYDKDPVHKQIKRLTSEIESLKNRRGKLISELKRRHKIDSYLYEDNTKRFKFKDDNLIGGTTQTAIMDDLTIYTIGSDNGKVNPQDIINQFIKKYSPQ